MQVRAVKDYESTDGFIRLVFLHRVEGEFAHFQLITFWESLECIKNFAGEDCEPAKYYPEDKKYLLEFEKSVKHFDVFAESASE